MENTTSNAQNTPLKRKQEESSTSAAAKSMRTAGKVNSLSKPQERNPTVLDEPASSLSATLTNPGQPMVNNNSSLHGSSYQLKLGMVIMLRLFKMKPKDNQHGSCQSHSVALSFEDTSGGKFDDITVAYSSRTFRIQAKHKNTTNDAQKTSSARDTVSEEDLLPGKEKEQKKGPFSLRMYFESARKVMKSYPNEKQTFMLCTNKPLHPDVTFFREVDIKSKQNIDFLDDLNGTCYQLNFNNRWKELDDVLKPASDADIKAFYDNFVLICNSHNAAELELKALELLRDLANNQFTTAYHALHTSIFAAMCRGATHKITSNVVKGVIKKLQLNIPISNKYSNMTLNAQMLQEPKLYEFLKNKNELTYTFPGYYNKDFSVHLITQMVSVYTENINKTHLNPTYEMLSIDCASYKDCEDVTDRLGADLSIIFNDEIYHLGHILVVIFTHNKTIQQAKLSSFEAKKSEKKQEKYGFKIIFIDTIEEGESSNGRTTLRKNNCESTWRVENLSEEVREQAYKRNSNLSLFGTTVSLEKLIENKDPLWYFIDLDAMHVQGCGISHEHNYKQIESWYVNRRFDRIYQHSQINSSLMYDNELLPNSNRYNENRLFMKRNTNNNFKKTPISEIDRTRMCRQSIRHKIDPTKHTILDDSNKLPGLESDESVSKVIIILNDAGFGKSTLFTKLAYRLSIILNSSYVIRLNGIAFSNDFIGMKSKDIERLDTAEVLKMLYYFIYLVLFEHSHTSKRETKQLIAEAKACAELLTYSDPIVSGDNIAVKQPNLSTSQLAALRVFIEKYNKKLLVVLLDGFDEIAPCYKEVVLRIFRRFSRLEGVRKMYISSRLYYFVEELVDTFPGCGMYKLKPLSYFDQVQFVRMYIQCKMKDCDSANKNLMFETIMGDFNNHPDEFKSVPLLLLVTLKTRFPIVKQNITMGNTYVNPRTNSGVLELFDAVVETKIRRSVLDKHGITLATLDNVWLNNQYLKMQRDMIHQYALLAICSMLGEKLQKILLTEDDLKKAKIYMDETRYTLDKTGIIIGIQDDTPQFIFRIFAEYFAALWLYKSCERMPKKDFFQCDFFWSDRWLGVRSFFDRMSLRECKGCDLHLAILNNSEVLENNLLSDNSVVAIDKFGRLPLHFAISHHGLSEEKQRMCLITPETINASDKLCEWSALDYAFAIGGTLKYDTRISNLMIKLIQQGAKVHIDILVKQTCSRDLEGIFNGAYNLGTWLHANKFEEYADQLYKGVVRFLVEEKQININTQFEELGGLSVLKYCIKKEMIMMFNQLLTQIVEIKDNAELELALYFTIDFNLVDSFRIIFQYLCTRYNTSTVNDPQVDENTVFEHVYEVEVDENTVFKDVHNIPLWIRSEGDICCVPITKNAVLQLSEQDSFIWKAIAKTVHKTNNTILDYIVKKTNITITKKKLMLIMQLLQTYQYAHGYRNRYIHSHSASIPAFNYLLDQIDIKELKCKDDEGRNLLQWTAQHGCLYLMQCLIKKGFDTSVINVRNGWNLYNYATFIENKHDKEMSKLVYSRSNEMLAYLLLKGGLNEVELFDSMLNSIIVKENQTCSNDVSLSVSIPNTSKLNKRQHALLGMVAMFDNVINNNFLNDAERKEAKILVRQIEQAEKTSELIKEVMNGIPKYTHTIFAEYLAACWLYENNQSFRGDKFVQIMLLHDSWYFARLRFIFDLIVFRHSNGCEIHHAFIINSETAINKLLSEDSSLAENKDELGRSPLHRAVHNKLIHLVPTLLHFMSLESINIRDELCQLSALDYAFETDNEQLVEMLIARGADVHIEVLAKRINSKSLEFVFAHTKKYATLLDSYERTKPCVKELNHQVVNNLLRCRKIDPNVPHYELMYNTVFQFCQRNGYDEILEEFKSQAGSSSVEENGYSRWGSLYFNQPKTF